MRALQLLLNCGGGGGGAAATSPTGRGGAAHDTLVGEPAIGVLNASSSSSSSSRLNSEAAYVLAAGELPGLGARPRGLRPPLAAEPGPDHSCCCSVTRRLLANSAACCPLQAAAANAGSGRIGVTRTLASSSCSWLALMGSGLSGGRLAGLGGTAVPSLLRPPEDALGALSKRATGRLLTAASGSTSATA